jgi:hypothetical protein
MIMMIEKLVEWLAGETEVLGENLLHCRFCAPQTPTCCPDVNPGRRGGKPATNRLSYGTASFNPWNNLLCLWSVRLGLT